MRITLLAVLCFLWAAGSVQAQADPAPGHVPVIYGERLPGFLDSLRRQVLADTSRFNQADVVFTAAGRLNLHAYAKLFIVNGRYSYKLDIVAPQQVVTFTEEVLSPEKVKSITVLDRAKTTPLFGPAASNGVVLITLFDEAKFEPRVAGGVVSKKGGGDNFSQRRKGELLIRY